MKKYISVLKNCGLFNDIEDENLIAMLGCLGAKVITVRKNEAIFSRGYQCEVSWYYFIRCSTDGSG